jgi:hypothetical protein
MMLQVEARLALLIGRVVWIFLFCFGFWLLLLGFFAWSMLCNALFVIGRLLVLLLF